jgi:antirestriction protein ArdC
MPARAAFAESHGYYSTLLHELTHWTSAEIRCDRKLGKRFGDDQYAAEELIAEIGSAFLGADLAIEPEVREDHAAYLQSWIKVLESDSKAIFTAASQAQKAVAFLNQLQTREVRAAA